MFEQPEPERRGLPPAALKAFVIAAGLAVAGMAIGVLGVQYKGRQVRRGWNMVPVMVAATDLKKGMVLTRASVESRGIPEQFATASLAKDVSGLEGKRVRVDLAKGTPVPLGALDSNWSCP